MKNLSVKPIFVSVSPTVEKDDLWLAFKILLQPWKWKNGKSAGEFREALAKLTRIKDVFLFDSGRHALYAVLMSLGLKERDEILIQSFTCTAAVGPILWVRARPIYVDISTDDYNMSPEDLEKKITSKAKAIVVQHTFGFSARMDEILRVAKKHKLIVIEDVAHSLGGRYQNKMLGTIGDAAIFSFGRSKIISSVSGGAVVVNSKIIANNLAAFYRVLKEPSILWIIRQLLHPLIFHCVKGTYNFFHVGKAVAILAKFLKLYTVSVSRLEKKGGRPSWGPAVLPNALAVLGLNQLKKLDKFNEHRKELAKVYEVELRKNKRLFLPKPIAKSKPVFLYFPIAFENGFIADAFLKKAQKENVYLEVWPARTVIGPEGANLNKLFYIAGSCPNAESLALRSVVLPTTPNTSHNDALAVINLIKNHVGY